MPRAKRQPKKCVCGCGQLLKTPTSLFRPGHDTVMLGELVNEYGGIWALKQFLDNMSQSNTRQTKKAA